MHQYTATVIRWIDGDTVDLRVDLGFRIWEETRFRVYGIDTPERGQPNYNEARLYCESVLPAGTTFQIETLKDPDKYGRWLVKIPSLVQDLIAAGLGVEYYGGTRAA